MRTSQKAGGAGASVRIKGSSIKKPKTVKQLEEEARLKEMKNEREAELDSGKYMRASDAAKEAAEKLQM